MNKESNSPDAFLWVLRSLTTGFLLGYLVSIYLAVVVSGWFPTDTHLEDLLAIGLLILFCGGYYLMWIRREGWSAILFLLWYASLWLMKIFIGGALWKEAPVPGIIMFILAVLFIINNSGEKRAIKKAISIE